MKMADRRKTIDAGNGEEGIKGKFGTRLKVCYSNL